MTDRIAAIQAMLAKNPDDVFLHYSLGMEHLSAGEYDPAAAAFRRCIELDADYLAAHVELGKALRSAGRAADAREAFAEALDLAGRLGERHVGDYVRQQLEGLPKG